jgi:hypothetical protein
LCRPEGAGAAISRTGAWREGRVDWAGNYTAIEEARAIAERLAEERR